MNINELIELMISLGGKRTDTADGITWVFRSGEFIGEFEPFFRGMESAINVGVDVSISHPDLSKLACFILGTTRVSNKQIEWLQYSEDITVQDDPSNTLKKLVQTELTRMCKLRLDETVESLSAKQAFPQKSLGQIMHLAALAYKGDVNQIRDYLNEMRMRHRTIFVPMITTEMVERALDMAAKHTTPRTREED